MRQLKSISQEEGGIPTIRMVLVMTFCKSTMEMVKVDLEDVDFVQIGAIGCIFSVLVTVAVETKTDDLL